ncbi:MAG: hypothetical protein ACFE94_00660 [Candidatus Hodarchaeota archaeon]
MLNKTKLNITAILLALGIGLAPTGFFLNGYFRDQVRANVPETLLTIQDAVVPVIESNFMGLGIPEVLEAIREQETQYIEDEIVKVRSIPGVLQYLKNLSMPIFLERINNSMTSTNISESLDSAAAVVQAKIEGSMSAQFINETLEQVINSNSSTLLNAMDVFFNNYTFQDRYYTSIEGISEFATNGLNKLNFTAAAQQSLLYGNSSAPGLIQDLVNGTGVLEFIEFYDNATEDPAIYNLTMQITYNSTWNQLTAVAEYITDYMWDSIVTSEFIANFSMTPSEYALLNVTEQFFNDEDWSITTKGITSISGVSEFITGGSYSLNYTETAQQRILYGYQDSPGILEDLPLGTGVSGFLSLYNATSGGITMQVLYNATYYQLKNLTSYLTQYMFDTVVPAQLALDGLTLESAAERDFYIQWANGSIFSGGIYLRDLSEELSIFLKTSSAAKQINNVIELIAVQNSTTLVNATDVFFNDYNFTANYSISLMGVSEFMSGSSFSHNYTIIAQERILYGYGEAPGILIELQSGLGLKNWLDFFQAALLNIGTNRTLMESTYNATWVDHLLPLGQYLQNYILGSIIGLSKQRGLEVGVPSPSSISLEHSKSLWDQANSSGFINDAGILEWYKAANGNVTAQNNINATYVLSNAQFTQIFNWLFTTIKDVVVPIIFILELPPGSRITTTQYAEILFLEQWANATVVPEGLDLGGGITGFEVGIPVKSNISFSMTASLFDTGNSSSFINKDGLLKWIDAAGGDSASRTELITTFHLSTDQLDLILNWLFPTFGSNVVPNIAFDLTGYSMTELAGFEFFRQWTNGTLFTEGIDPGPAFGLESLSGWELGLPTASNIEFDPAVQLWSEENPESLVTPTGISRWFKAMEVSSTYNYLKAFYTFTDDQMHAIFDWLVKIRDDFALFFSQSELDLPRDPYEFGNLLLIGCVISGLCLIAIGVLLLVIMKLYKRR